MIKLRKISSCTKTKGLWVNLSNFSSVREKLVRLLESIWVSFSMKKRSFLFLWVWRVLKEILIRKSFKSFWMIWRIKRFMLIWDKELILYTKLLRFNLWTRIKSRKMSKLLLKGSKRYLNKKRFQVSRLEEYI